MLKNQLNLIVCSLALVLSTTQSWADFSQSPQLPPNYPNQQTINFPPQNIGGGYQNSMVLSLQQSVNLQWLTFTASAHASNPYGHVYVNVLVNGNLVAQNVDVTGYNTYHQIPFNGIYGSYVQIVPATYDLVQISQAALTFEQQYQGPSCAQSSYDFAFTDYCRNYGGHKHDFVPGCTYVGQCPSGCYANVDNFWNGVQQSQGELDPNSCQVYPQGNQVTIRCDYRAQHGVSSNSFHISCHN